MSRNLPWNDQLRTLIAALAYEYQRNLLYNFEEKRREERRRKRREEKRREVKKDTNWCYPSETSSHEVS